MREGKRGKRVARGGGRGGEGKEEGEGGGGGGGVDGRKRRRSCQFELLAQTGPRLGLHMVYIAALYHRLFHIV